MDHLITGRQVRPVRLVVPVAPVVHQMVLFLVEMVVQVEVFLRSVNQANLLLAMVAMEARLSTKDQLLNRAAVEVEVEVAVEASLPLALVLVEATVPRAA